MHDFMNRLEIQWLADGGGGAGTVAGDASTVAAAGAPSSPEVQTGTDGGNTIKEGYSYSERHKARVARMEAIQAQLAARDAQPATPQASEQPDAEQPSGGTEQPVPDPEPGGTDKTEPQKTIPFRDRMKALKAESPAEFQAYFDEQFGSRHKDYKSMREAAGKRQPVFDLLARQYGSDDPDIILGGLKKSMRLNAQWQELADSEGLTADQYMDKVLGDAERARIKAENDQLRASVDQRAAEEDMDRRVNQLAAEADALSAKYPQFDLSKELENPDFQRYLKMGNGVEDSYLLTHHETIENTAARASAAQAAATQAAEKKVLDNIRARGARPPESGMRSYGTVSQTRPEPGKMTREERRRIAEEAMRGHGRKL